MDGGDSGGDGGRSGGEAQLPAIRKKERDYMGMLEYDKREEPNIIKALIYGQLRMSHIYSNQSNRKKM